MLNSRPDLSKPLVDTVLRQGSLLDKTDDPVVQVFLVATEAESGDASFIDLAAMVDSNIGVGKRLCILVEGGFGEDNGVRSIVAEAVAEEVGTLDVDARQRTIKLSEASARKDWLVLMLRDRGGDGNEGREAVMSKSEAQWEVDTVEKSNIGLITLGEDGLCVFVLFIVIVDVQHVKDLTFKVVIYRILTLHPKKTMNRLTPAERILRILRIIVIKHAIFQLLHIIACDMINFAFRFVPFRLDLSQHGGSEANALHRRASNKLHISCPQSPRLACRQLWLLRTSVSGYLLQAELLELIDWRFKHPVPSSQDVRSLILVIRPGNRPNMGTFDMLCLLSDSFNILREGVNDDLCLILAVFLGLEDDPLVMQRFCH